MKNLVSLGQIREHLKNTLAGTSLTLYLQAVILCALTIIVYHKSLSGNFVFDDYPNIVEVPEMSSTEMSTATISEIALNYGNIGTLRPVARTSFFLNSYFFGLESAYSFKVVNLLIHFLNGLLVFFLCRKLIAVLINPDYAEKLNRAHFPFFVSLIWLLHPLNVSGVAYVVQRMNLLSTFFTLIGIILFLLAKLRYREGKSCAILLFLGIPLSLIFGVLNKENAILLTTFCILIEYLSPDGKYKKPYNQFTYFTVFFWAIPTLLAFSYILYSWDDFLGTYLYRDFTMVERLLTQPRVLLFYLQQILLPFNQSFSLYHDDYITSRSLISPLSTLPAIFVIIGLVCCIFIFRKRQPILAFGCGFFLIGHSIESSFISLEMVFEHRNYAPSIGVVISFISLFYFVFMYKKKIFYGTLIPYSCYVMLIGFTQASIWGNSLLHIELMHHYHPNSYRSTFEMARVHSEYARLKDDENSKKAELYAKKALELNQSAISPLTILLDLHHRFNKPSSHEVIEMLKRRVASEPISAENAAVLFKLASVAEKIEDKLPAETLETILDTAINNPRKTRRISGHLWFAKSQFYLNRGDLNSVINSLQIGLTFDPRSLNARELLIRLLAENGYLDEAEEQLKAFDSFIVPSLPLRRRQSLEKLIEEHRKDQT